MNAVVRKINSQVELHLKKYMDASSEKLNRPVEMRYYTPKVHQYGNAEVSGDNNLSASSSQVDQSQNQRNSKRPRQRSKSFSSNSNHNHNRNYNQNQNKQPPRGRSSLRQTQPKKQYNAHGSAFSISTQRVNFSDINNEKV